MKELVYVSGHKNPDTDSICSAIGYAYLLKAIDRYPLRSPLLIK